MWAGVIVEIIPPKPCGVLMTSPAVQIPGYQIEIKIEAEAVLRKEE